MSEKAEVKLNLLEKATYALKSRETLIAEHASFAAEIITLKASMAAAEAEKTELSARIADLEIEAQTGKEMAEEVLKLKAEAKTAEQRAVSIAAESLVAVADLPKASEEIKPSGPLTNAEKEAALKACKTNDEKMDLFRSWKK